MKKMTIMVVLAMLCLNFCGFSQKNMKYKNCVPDTTTTYKWGFTGFKSGYASISKITPLRLNKWRRLIVYNQTLPELYAIALGAGVTFTTDRIIIDVREPNKLKARYCYELQIPPQMIDVMFATMQKNLVFEYPDYEAAVVQKNGLNYVLITDKEDGILLKPVKDNKPIKKDETVRSNTYQVDAL